MDWWTIRVREHLHGDRGRGLRPDRRAALAIRARHRSGERPRMAAPRCPGQASIDECESAKWVFRRLDLDVLERTHQPALHLDWNSSGVCVELFVKTEF